MTLAVLDRYWRYWGRGGSGADAGGVTLKELTAQAGMPLDAVQSCVLRIRRRLSADAGLRRHHAQVKATPARVGEAGYAK